MKRILLTLLCCGLFVSAVIAYQTPNDVAKNSDMCITIRTMQSNSATIPIAARVGDKITVSQESNASTGYKWQCTEKPNRKITLHMESDYYPADQRIPGKGGTQVFSFAAMGKGTTTTTLKYARSWEKNVAPVKIQKFKITVQ